MPGQQFVNYVQTTLASGCTNIATVLTLVSVAGLPTVGNFRLRIDDVAPATTFEIVEVTSVNVGASQVTCTRAMEGTSGIAHSAGAFVGNKITAAMLLTLPQGTLEFHEVSAPQGTFTALTDLTGLAVTQFLVNGRRYRISTVVPLSTAGGTADILAIAIREGATVLQGDQTLAVNQAGGFTTLRATKVIVGDGASHTYKISAERSAGTGNVTMNAGGIQVGITYYAHILLEDIGL